MVLPLVALLATSALAEPTRWTPSISLGLGSFQEQQALTVDGATSNGWQSQYRAFLTLGLAHPIVSFSPSVSLDGHAALGTGPTFVTGHWHALVRQDVTFAFTPTTWLTLRAGLGLGFTLDASGPDRSFAEVAVPIGVTFFRLVEVVYRPFLSVPAGGETVGVAGGTRTLSTRLLVMPFEGLSNAATASGEDRALARTCADDERRGAVARCHSRRRRHGPRRWADLRRRHPHRVEAARCPRRRLARWSASAPPRWPRRPGR